MNAMEIIAVTYSEVLRYHDYEKRFLYLLHIFFLLARLKQLPVARSWTSQLAMITAESDARSSQNLKNDVSLPKKQN